MPRRFFHSTGYAFGTFAFVGGALLHVAIAYRALQLRSYLLLGFCALVIPLSLLVARGSWHRYRIEKEEEKIL